MRWSPYGRANLRTERNRSARTLSQLPAFPVPETRFTSAPRLVKRLKGFDFLRGLFIRPLETCLWNAAIFNGWWSCLGGTRCNY